MKDLTLRDDEGFVLKGISFSQQRQEKIAIAGETGAGKSSLLKLIAGLLQPDGGELIFEGKPVIGPRDQLVPGHPGIAFLSQHFELQKSLRVEQVLAYANTLDDRDSEHLYAVCQIDHLLGRRTDQLSGGEKQRVAISRLLISSPRLLLLDEPFSHLDMAHKQTLKEVVGDIGDKLGITCILVSHDPLDTLSWADKILILKGGECVQMDRPDAIYHQPANEYAAGLFGKYNLITKDRFRTFSRLPAFKALLKNQRRESVFLRPEALKIVTKSPTALRGRVERLRFFGSYYEADVRLTNGMVTVRSASFGDLHEGATVYVTIDRKALPSVAKG